MMTIVHIPISIALGKLFWNDLEDFLTSVRYWFTPDIISLFRGEWDRDWFEQMKIMLWGIVCFGFYYGEVTIVWRVFFGNGQ